MLKRMSLPVIGTLLVALLFVATLAIGMRARSSTAVDPEVIAAFQEVRSYIADLPTVLLNEGQRNSLLKKLENAERAYSRGKPCTSVNVVDAYLRETRALRKDDRVKTAEYLYLMGYGLRSDVLKTLAQGETCRGHERFSMNPHVEIQESDNRHLVGSMQFGEPQLGAIEVDDELYTQVTIPEVESRLGEPGEPGVPVVRRLIAVPRGAEVTIHTSPPTVAETFDLNVFPLQPRTPDQDDGDESFPDFVNNYPPFEKREDLYASDEPFPAEVCTVTPLGQYRDLPLAQIACAAGQYYANSARYVSYASVGYELTFVGGNGAFVTDASQNPFEPQIRDYADALLNKDDVFDYVEQRQPEPICAGEELLIVTHEDFRLAADKLAKWKNENGMTTNVVEVDDATTAAQIADYIHSRYDDCVVRPSYILLLGDAEYVPTFYVWTVFSSKSASDFPYANYSTSLVDVFIPDFGVGRLPVDTLQQANDVVSKLIRYEGSPPFSGSFYQNLSFAAMFECCRFDTPPISIGYGAHGQDGWDRKAYVETSELIRDALLDKNYGVDRIYSEEKCDLYKEDDTPRFHYDGTPLPTDIGPGSGFAWDGSAQDIVNAMNNGRFLILQRDHGSEKGWMSPSFSQKNFPSLTNTDLLPVVFSVNCSSGFFDNETNPGETPQSYRASHPYPSIHPQYGGDPQIKDKTYFSEELLRLKDRGAVGIIAATRDTPDVPDDALTRGLFDAVWPDVIPSYGGTTSLRRLGDILNYAKLYVLTQAGVPQPLGNIYPLDVLAIYPLFHVLGDPSLALWTSKPAKLGPDYTLLDQCPPKALCVEYELNGANITAFQQDDTMAFPLGRATVNNGEAIIEFLKTPDPELPVLLAVTQDGAVGRLLTTPTPEPVDLVDETSFSGDAKRITFDEEGRFPNEAISDQYESLGVFFVDDDQITPRITAGDVLMDASPHSQPYFLFNDADTETGGGASLTIEFATPVERVGMYIGNGWGCSDIFIPGQAFLAAYDETGEQLYSVARQNVCRDLNTFIGLGVGVRRIAQVRLNYQPSTFAEAIDDLIFE